jgi:hypothetical protein
MKGDAGSYHATADDDDAGLGRKRFLLAGHIMLSCAGD